MQGSAGGTRPAHATTAAQAILLSGRLSLSFVSTHARVCRPFLVVRIPRRECRALSSSPCCCCCCRLTFVSFLHLEARGRHDDDREEGRGERGRWTAARTRDDEAALDTTAATKKVRAVSRARRGGAALQPRLTVPSASLFPALAPRPHRRGGRGRSCLERRRNPRARGTLREGHRFGRAAQRGCE